MISYSEKTILLGNDYQFFFIQIVCGAFKYQQISFITYNYTIYI